MSPSACADDGDRSIDSPSLDGECAYVLSRDLVRVVESTGTWLALRASIASAAVLS